MDGVSENKMDTSPAAPLAPANRVTKGPLDRFLFRGKPAINEKSENSKLPEPEVVIVADTTDCIDISSGTSSSGIENHNNLKQQVIEETLAENDASDAQAGFTVTDTDDSDAEDGRESSKSGKHSALGVKTGNETPGNTQSAKKRRRLSLDEKKAREAEMERKKAEREKMRQEKERHKIELENAKKARLEAREKKIQAMKEAEKEREEKRKQSELEKEEKRKQAELEKEEKRKQAELEKEEKRKQAELEREEKRKQAEREKEEKRKAKEAEKQLAEDSKRRRLEEEQQKAAKAAEMFKKHFKVVASSKDANKDNESADTSYKSFGPFKMFQLRPNQRLAPICRLSRDDRDLAKTQLDKFLAEQDEKADLLKDYRAGSKKFRSSGGTYPKPESDVIQLDENHSKSVMRAKLLQFDEDIRPPYFGTWRKTTKNISARHPFGQDTGIFDYECDSAAEWEEPEDGEDILSSSKDSEEETDATNKSDEEEEDGFIVPHGYLSTDEEEAREEEEQQNLPPSDVKMKNRIQDTYELGFKKLAKSLRPIFFGPELVDSGRPLPVDLNQFQPLFYDPIPPDFEAILCGEVVVPDPEPPKEAHVDKSTVTGDSAVPGGEASAVKKSKLAKEGDANGGTPGQPSTKIHKKPVPEEGYPALIRYVHGNSAGIGRLIEGFIVSFAQEPVIGCEVSKRQVERQIFAIAERTTKSDRHPTACWYVRDDVLGKYNLSDLPVPNLTHAPSPAPKRPRKQLKLPPLAQNGEAEEAAANGQNPTPADAAVPTAPGKPATAPKTPTIQPKVLQVEVAAIGTAQTAAPSPGLVKTTASIIPKTPTFPPKNPFEAAAGVPVSIPSSTVQPIVGIKPAAAPKTPSLQPKNPFEAAAGGLVSGPVLTVTTIQPSVPAKPATTPKTPSFQPKNPFEAAAAGGAVKTAVIAGQKTPNSVVQPKISFEVINKDMNNNNS